MKKNIPVEIKFRSTASDMCHLVSNIVDDMNDRGVIDLSPGIIRIAAEWIQGNEPTELLSLFIQHSSDYWDMIMERDTSFFVESADKMFGSSFLGEVKAFKIILTAKDKKGRRILTDEDEDSIWDYLIALVKQSTKYILANEDDFDIDVSEFAVQHKITI